MTAAEHRLGIGTAPPTPPSGYISLYGLSDKKLYYKDDAGVENPLAIGGVVGPANSVYLSVGGVDGSAARGDASKPFGTFKAALEACLNGDCLKIGPGVFTLAGAGDVPIWPAGLHRLVIEGAGYDLTSTMGTVLQNTGNDGSHIIAPPSHVTSLILVGLRASVTLGTGRPLYCDGAGSGGSYMSGGLSIRDCMFTATSFGARIKDVNFGFIFNTYFGYGGSSTLELMSNAAVQFKGCTFEKVSPSYNPADADRPGFSAETSFDVCSFSNDVAFSGGGAGFKNKFTACDLKTLRADGAPLTGLISLKIYGGWLEGINFSADTLADVASNNVNAYNLHINTELKIYQAGSVNPFTAEIRNCDLRNIGAAGILAGNGVTLDLRGSNIQLTGAQLGTPGTGKVLPSMILRTYTTDGTTPDVITPDQAGGVTFAATPDYCMASCKGGVGAGIVAATPTSPTQVTINYGGGAGDITVASYWG